MIAMRYYSGIVLIFVFLFDLVLSSPVLAADVLDQKGLIHQGRVQKNEWSGKQFICDGGNGEALLAGEFVLDRNAAENLNRLGFVSVLDEQLNRFVLYKGRLLLACKKPVRLLLANADLDIAANSLVYISDNGAGTCEILNLHDEHSEAVLVRVGETQFELAPGRQVLLSSNLNSGFDDLNLCAGLRFRNVSQSNPVPTIKAFFSQYALPSAMQVSPAICRLAKSGTKQGNRMLKTAAAVYAASGYPSDFCANVAGSPASIEVNAGTANGGTASVGVIAN